MVVSDKPSVVLAAEACVSATPKLDPAFSKPDLFSDKSDLFVSSHPTFLFGAGRNIGFEF